MTKRDVILLSAFWSGKLTYRKWRGLLGRGPQGHMGIFVQAFLHLPMDWLLKEISNEKFISIWPDVRKEFLTGSVHEQNILNAWDAIWGVNAAGDAQYPVSSEVAHLSKRQREILKTIVCNPGISIYELARRLNRDYSRVLKDIKRLEEAGEIEIKPDPHSCRNAKQLMPVHSINAKLQEADLKIGSQAHRQKAQRRI